MTDRYQHVPAELTEQPNWCCFRLEWDEEREKYTKRPYNPLTGQYSKSNDPLTWVDYDDAEDAVLAKNSPYDGIGYFFDGNYYGVDLDNVESEIMRYQQGDNEENIVADFVDLLQSYAEISPSGTGVHIICKGQLPQGGRRKGNIEMYDKGRFFTVTGNRIGDYVGIFDDSEIGKINYLHHKYIGEQSISVEDLSAVDTSTGNDVPIEELIELAKKSKNGLRFQCFMDGKWEQFYKSQSEADLAFCNDLAYWTACDPDKMDAIYRKSAMMRSKWDSKRENSTYGWETIKKAILGTSNTYQPVGGFDLKIKDMSVKPKLKPKHFSYDDTGNSGRFMRAFGERVKYSYNNKKWYYYSGKVWVMDDLGKVYEMADMIANSIGKEPIFVADENDEKAIETAEKALKKHQKYTRSVSGKRNMLVDTQHQVSIGTDAFDRDPYLFNTTSGYIDLNNRHLMNHNSSKMMSKMSYSEYNPEADCPQWIKFLGEIFQGNQELIDYIQRAIGYSMSGDVSEQVMFFLVGDGQNGKSVFVNVLNDVMGSYGMAIQPSTLMASNRDGSSASPDIARLKGARFVTTSEPNKGMKLDEGIVKQMTGDDKITARHLNAEFFEYKPEFKIWMTTNHKPIIQGTDTGIWRRIVIIPFEYQIPKEKIDKKLTSKLKGELTGILNWCVYGYEAWRENGLMEPDLIAKQRGEYRNEMDIVHRFVDENCALNPNVEEPANDLWKAYHAWVKEGNEWGNMSRTKFGIELSKRFEKKKDGKGNIVYRGLKLNSSELSSDVKRSNVISFLVDNH
ncbi:phage/plasmid primase, P4 family [Facklamia hominis]|uniref:phage/plasmid primase, P4 family n=1 Tax=Facklamia hominis TaxID=178214 RepID=UPI0038FCB964